MGGPELDVSILFLIEMGSVHIEAEKASELVTRRQLIERVGLKGTRSGDVGTHKHHALVLVNFVNASGHDIKAFSQVVQQAVKECFDILLQPEVNFCC